MRDALENKLEKGQFVRWHIGPEDANRGLKAEIVHVSDGGISLPRGCTPAEIHLLVRLTFPTKAGTEIQFNGLDVLRAELQERTIGIVA